MSTKKLTIFVLASLLMLVITSCTKGTLNSSTLFTQQLTSNASSIQHETNKPTSNSAADNVGLLLVFTYPDPNQQNRTHGPVPKLYSYKSIWITREGTSVNYIQKDSLAAVPGKDGFYKIDSIKMENLQSPKFEKVINKVITYKVGSDHQSQIDLDENETRNLVYSYEGSKIDFIGKEFYAITQLRSYTTGAGGWQYQLKNRFCMLGNSIPADTEEHSSTGGLIDWRDILPQQIHASVDNQIDSYKAQYNQVVKYESDHDKQYISASDLTLRRKEGAWRFVVPVKLSNWKESHNYFTDFKVIICPLSVNLVSHDTLCIPWAKVKELNPEAKDAVSAPDNSLLVVQTGDKLKVYSLPMNDIDNPTLEIPMNESDEMILNQWCDKSHVSEWTEELSNLK